MGSESDSSDSDISLEDEISVNIQSSNGSKIPVSTMLYYTVADFKSVIARSSDVPAEQQRLVYKGRVLKDDHTLDSYGLQADHTIHMVRGFPPASNPPSGPANSGIPNTTPACPEFMREIMRYNDRAMINIESSPEGFHMLRRMYENGEEPFWNATTMGGDASLWPQGAADGQQRDGSNSPSTTGAETGGPNTNPLPNPWNNAPTGPLRSLPPLRGLGLLPESDQMLGGAPNLPPMSQMMQNPAMAQMMQNPVVAQMMQDPALAEMIHRALSNPEYMSQMHILYTELCAVTDANSRFQQMMQEELLRQLVSPETVQQMMSPQQSLLSPMNPSQTNTDPLQACGASVAPDERFAMQLAQLQEMGFIDAQENIRALVATCGDVHAAVDRLLGKMGQ